MFIIPLNQVVLSSNYMIWNQKKKQILATLTLL